MRERLGLAEKVQSPTPALTSHVLTRVKPCIQLAISFSMLNIPSKMDTHLSAVQCTK